MLVGKYLREVLFFISILFSIPCVLSQNISTKYIDSLYISVKNKSDSEVIKTLKDLKKIIAAQDINDAIRLYEYCLSKESSDFFKMNMLKVYSSYLVPKNLEDKALPLLLKGLTLSKKLNDDSSVIHFSINISSIYLFDNLPDKALFYLNEAQVLAENRNIEKSLAGIFYLKAMVYESVEDIEQATLFYKKAWSIIDKDPNHKERGFYLYILVDYFSRIGNSIEFSKFTEKLALYLKNKNPETPTGHIPIDGVFNTSADPKNIANYIEVIRIGDSLGITTPMVYSALTLAEIFIKIDKPKEAIKYLQEVEKKLDTLELKQQLMVIYQKLSKSNIAAKNFEEAFRYKNLESQLRSFLISEKMKNNIAELEIKYNLQTKERELEKQVASKKFLYLMLGSAFVLLAFISFFFSKNRKKNKLLAQQKQMLEKTLGEKNILLRETHHRVKNSFQMVSSLLYLQSENVADKEAKRAIKEAQNRVRSMVLIHHKLYNKKQLVGIDTKEYIEDLTKDIFESHLSQTIHLTYKLEVESMILSVDTITPIGLILNELIINALKHAFDVNTKEGLLQITFFKKEEQLILQVVDNGKGFIENDKEYSFGLKLIRALASQLEASFKINSDIGKGTEVILTITDFEIVT